MDPGESEQPDREELASRVDELEQTVSKMLPDRRGVLKGLGAAAIGGAAVGGATGGASGQSAAGQIGTESEPVDVEGAQGNFDSVNTGQLINTTDQVNRVAGNKRPLVTTEDTAIYVDPDNGNDEGEGTEANPVRTIREAFQRQPFFLLHKFDIVLEAGVHPDVAATQPPSFSTFKTPPVPFEFYGKTGNRDDVIVKAQLGFGYFHGEQDSPQVRDITVDSTIGTKIGNITYENIHFRGEGQPLATNGNTVAFNDHTPTVSRVADCTFSSNYDEGIRVTKNAVLEVESVDGQTAEYGIVARGGATVNMYGNVGLIGTKGRFRKDRNATIRRYRGWVGNDPFLHDDFGDGGVVSRDPDDRLRTVNQHYYRPRWSVVDGNTVITGGQMEIPAGDKPYVETGVLRGEFAFDFNFESAPSSGNIQLNPHAHSNPIRYSQMRVSADGSLEVRHYDGSFNTTITGSWDNDTNTHRVELIKTDSGHELRYDGSVIGTDSFTYDPFAAGSSDCRVEMKNDSDVQVNVERVNVAQAPF